MSENPLQTVFHTVSCHPFDGTGDKNFLLADALKKAYTGGLAKGSARGVEAGRIVRTRYKIGNGDFRWRKFSGKTVVQETFRRPDGFRLIAWDLSGKLVSEAVYGKNLEWVRSAYFAETPGRPNVVLRPHGEEIELLEFDPNSGKYRREKLLPCPVRPLTAAQSYVNSMVGSEPRVLARTSEGLFCYCVREEAEKRIALFRHFY